MFAIMTGLDNSQLYEILDNHIDIDIFYNLSRSTLKRDSHPPPYSHIRDLSSLEELVFYGHWWDTDSYLM